MALMTSEDRTDLIASVMFDLAPFASIPLCMKCRFSKHIEWHHVCGRWHDPEFLAGKRGHVVPLCYTCHKGRWGIHTALAQARIDLQYTADENERSQRALRAVLTFLWWLDEQAESDRREGD